MDGYWNGYGSVGGHQGPISILNECFKFLDNVVVMIDKRNIYPEMKQPQLHKIQSSKQLKTLASKIKQVVLRLQKLFNEQKKQTKDVSSLVKQKEDSLIAFLNQCMLSRKETKYINQRASQICYSQKNKKQLVALIEKMTKDKETVKQIQNYLKPGLQSCTGKVKGILQQNKKVKEFQEIFIEHETRIWQLFRYTQNQGKKETFNSNNSKKGSEKYLQTYVKLDEMRIFMRSLDQKLNLYRDQKAKQWEERLGKPIDRMLYLLQNKQPIQNQINRILINLYTHKHESFETDIKDCDKSMQQILRKIKTEFETSAANAKRICDKINDKIRFYINKKVSVDNTSKLYNTNSILGEIYKGLSDYENLFEIYEIFVKQINNLSFINQSSQTKLPQRLKAYIKDLQQVDNRIKMYVLPNIFPFKNEVAKSKDQNQMKMISIKQYEQIKRLFVQNERYKLMIRTIQKENEENIQKIENYIKQILQKTQLITQQKLQNLQYYNLQKAKLQKLEQQYQKTQKVINIFKINQQQLLKNVKSLTEQLQGVKKQFEQKQKHYQNTILSSKQAEARMTNQKTVLLQKQRSLKAQISELNKSFKSEKEQFKEHLSKGVVYFVDNSNQKNSLLLRKIEILQKRIDSIVGFFKILKDKRQKTKLQIQILKQTVNKLEIDRLQKHIVNLKDKIQSMQAKIDELTVNLSEKSLVIDVLNNKIYQITQQQLATITMIKTQSSFTYIVNRYQAEISQLKGQLLCQQSKFNRAQDHIKNLLVWLNQIQFNSSSLQSSHKATDDLKMIQDSTIMIEGKVYKLQKNISEQSNLLSKNHIKKYFTEIKEQISKLQNSLKSLLSLKETMKLLHTIGLKLQKSINPNDRDSQLMLMDISIIEKKPFEANEEIIMNTRPQFVQIE